MSDKIGARALCGRLTVFLSSGGRVVSVCPATNLMNTVRPDRDWMPLTGVKRGDIVVTVFGHATLTTGLSGGWGSVSRDAVTMRGLFVR